MLKKIITILLFLSFIPLAYAVPPSYGLTQIYIGAGPVLSTNVPYNPREYDKYGRKGSVELFTGYGINWTQYFFSGAELFGTKVTNGNYTWGGRVVPGVYFLNNLMVFAALGVVGGNNYPFVNSHPSTNPGVQFGAGLQLDFSRTSFRGGWYRNNFNVGSTKNLSSVDQYYLTFIYHFMVSPGIACPEC